MKFRGISWTFDEVGVLAVALLLVFPADLHAQDETPNAPPLQPAAASIQGEEQANLGHYSVAGYEFFAEEPIFNKVGDTTLDKNVLRKRVYVLPRILLLPNGVAFFDAEGRRDMTVGSFQSTRIDLATSSSGEVLSDHKIDLCSCGSSAKNQCRCGQGGKRESVFSGIIRFRVDSGGLSRIAKYVIAAHYLNKPIDPSIVALPADTDSVLPSLSPTLGDVSPEKLDALYDKLDAVDGFTSCLQFHQVAPRSLSVVVNCGGKELSRLSFPASAYISSNSIMAVEVQGLPESVVHRIASGWFTIQADMEIDLARQQIARADINLRKLNRFFAEEYAKRDTQVTQSSRGFLFWKKTEQAVRTLVSQDSRMQGGASNEQSYSIDLRDADASLRERVNSFVFDRQEGGAELLDEILKNHQTAALDRSAGDAERKAHLAYVEYLKTLRSGDGDPERENNALNALADLAKSLAPKADAPEGAGVAAAASAGNPYLAMGMFLVNGIVWKNSSIGDSFVASSLQQASWTDEQSRSFSAAIQNQRKAGFTIVQSYFPLLEQFNEFYGKQSDDVKSESRLLLEKFDAELTKRLLPSLK